MSSNKHEENLAKGKQRKELGDAEFKKLNGDVKDALGHYHRALLYIKGLDGNTTDIMAGNTGDQSATISPEKKEINDLLEKIYSNICACLIKQERWQRAVDTADQVLAKNPNNVKAKFRKAKAWGELGFFEKAINMLEDLLKSANETDGNTFNLELDRIKMMEREVTKKADKKMRGFLKKTPNLLGEEQTPQATSTKEVDSAAS